ncbi:hypothetical protein [Chamaesiphon minutus]|uniref:Uncharacterized protein n=1 Tax=Chamaesiphon minutus (strain ATCC 27169 / PCC 6605) TaxID=1173020 RepID=K9UP67_CHAP6|nr:hypothetical protein [Chamaesiphon minutus]AFY95989.1 hypothetical protein Cha6605_5088 [Chamaesiphon minutus PCC 6605]
MNYLPVCTYNIANWCDPPDRMVHQQVIPLVGAAPNTCPVELTALGNLLVRDLPSYANRLIQQRRKRTDKLYSSIVTASKPELKPIEIVSREYSPQFPQAAPTQVFITTLENQYTGNRVAQIQQFHWLFIAQTRLGWRLVNIYTRTGGFPIATTLISPPIESSKTIVGEAIATWLNDCYLGKIRR